MTPSDIMGKMPFFRLLAFYSAGLLSAGILKKPLLPIIAVIVIIILSLTALILLKSRSLKRWHDVLTATTLFIIMFFTGVLATYPDKIKMEYISAIPEQGVFIAAVAGLPEAKPNSIQAELMVIAIKDSVIRRVKKFRVLVYFQKDTAAALLEPGMLLCLNANLQPPAPPSNPGEFRYDRYLLNQGICRQGYVSSKNWHLLSQHFINAGIASTICRKQLISKFSTLGLSRDEFATLSALTLGYRNALNMDVKRAFTAAGVMHVMALSGFNVAVIATFLGFMMYFTRGNIPGNRFRTITILPAIWCFAFVTGLSPSVTRAAVMLSLTMTGSTLGRQSFSPNMILGSAFLMLLVKPGLISDTGFQLSFCAVYGIIAYQPVLGSIVKLRPKCLNHLWQFFTLSLAAQIATLPVSLYYFRQFPVYFWLTNLYVIPLVSCIIYVSSFFLIFSFIKPLAVCSGKLLALLVKILIKSVSVAEKAPCALIDDITVSKIQMLILFLLFVFLVLFIKNRKRIMLNFSLLCGIIILIYGTVTVKLAENQNFLAVNNIRGSTVMSFISGRECLLVARPDSLITPSVLSWSFDNFLNIKRIKHVKVYDFSDLNGELIPGFKYINLDSDNLVLFFNGNSILRIANLSSLTSRMITAVPYHTENTDSAANEIKPTFDILLISCKDYWSMEKVISTLNFKILVIDSSISQYYSGKWAEACLEHNVPFHDVRNGAYVIDR